MCFPIVHTKKIVALKNGALASSSPPLPQCLRPCLKVAQTYFHNSLSYLTPMPHFIPMLRSILEPSRPVRNLPPDKERTDKKLFVMLSRFWLLKGVRVNLLKQRKIIDKNIFQVRLNEFLKICKKNDICWCKSWFKTTRNKKNGSCIL